MRVFIYEDNEKLLELLCNDLGVSPTKYINNLIKSQETICQIHKAEVTNDKNDRTLHGRDRFTKS